MKIALHVHTNRYSICSKARPEDMLEEYVDCGFDVVFLTEHDAIWSPKELSVVRHRYPSIQIFPGVELTLFQPQSLAHLLILGATNDDFLYMASPDQIVDAAKEEGLLSVYAHPYRYTDSDEMLRRGIYPDAIELRSNTHKEDHSKGSITFAEEHAIKLVNSDDAHRIEDVGNFWIETDRPMTSPQELRSIILAGDYGCCQLD